MRATNRCKGEHRARGRGAVAVDARAAAGPQRRAQSDVCPRSAIARSIAWAGSAISASGRTGIPGCGSRMLASSASFPRCWPTFAAIAAASPRKTATSTLRWTRRSSIVTSMHVASPWKRRSAAPASAIGLVLPRSPTDRRSRSRRGRRFSLRALLLDPTVLTRRKVASVVRTHFPWVRNVIGRPRPSRAGS